ncbi:MAG: hypothetical protein FWG25_08175 [Promicromonosporaceae bacterium]|nr:hypothetical protein [Promicromonosporaceae bacterium]
MRILIAFGTVPFKRHDVDRKAAELVAELQAAGHDVETFPIPIGETESGKLDSLLAAGLTIIENSEMVIALSSPADKIPHQNLVVWNEGSA